MTISENYLDPDFAYFLGLIAGRGTLTEQPGDRKVVIEFPFKNLEAEGIRKKYNQDDHLNYSLYQISERLKELTETDVAVVKSGHAGNLVIRFLRNSLVWRNLKYLLGDFDSFHNFQIPIQIFEAPDDIKKEFVRGIADCAGFIRESNNYMGGKRRVYFEIANKNWILPLQICALLQRELKIPVQLIQWGHPNTREPKKFKNKKPTWAREHQIKIFSEAFKPIGFYVKYKQEILEEFVNADVKHSGNIVFCNPNPSIRRKDKKPKHIGEKSEQLPEFLRGKHFNNYWQICVTLGCEQCQEVDKNQIKMFKEKEEVVEDE